MKALVSFFSKKFMPSFMSPTRSRVQLNKISSDFICFKPLRSCFHFRDLQWFHVFHFTFIFSLFVIVKLHNFFYENTFYYALATWVSRATKALQCLRHSRRLCLDNNFLLFMGGSGTSRISSSQTGRESFFFIFTLLLQANPPRTSKQLYQHFSHHQQ